MVKWQPIATSPKDGTPILGMFDDGNVLWLKWMLGQYGMNWYDYDGEGTFCPTHWMPLPAGPASLPEGQKGER